MKLKQHKFNHAEERHHKFGLAEFVLNCDYDAMCTPFAKERLTHAWLASATDE